MKFFVEFKEQQTKGGRVIRKPAEFEADGCLLNDGFFFFRRKSDTILILSADMVEAIEISHDKA